MTLNDKLRDWIKQKRYFKHKSGKDKSGWVQI